MLRGIPKTDDSTGLVRKLEQYAAAARTIIFIALILTSIMILSACTDKMTDTVTEEKIEVIEKPSQSLTKVVVETDGMLVDGYDSPHPFGMTREVWVDSKYYEKNEISRGDIVVFKTKNNTYQQTDIARIVGIPRESVTIKKGQVYINGIELDTFYGNDNSSKNNDSMDQPVTLGENEYFILADIRWRGINDSQSVKAGFLKYEILGKVVGYDKNE